ncbi:MAG TPA: ImmA/IrrE family metallo-endopeptidase [Pyrinomonadaceae bacterium]
MNTFVLPPTEKRKHYELRALALRDFAGVQAGEALDPFALAQFAKLLVVDFDQIKGLSDESREHLLGAGTDEWSGGACSQPLPNGWRIVILNPAHGVHRNRATLMEEIAHVFLGHKPNRLAVVEQSDFRSSRERSWERVRSLAAKGKKEKMSSIGATSPHPNPLPKGEGTRLVARDYNKSDEEAAYAIGAAALVPYAALRQLVFEGRTAEQIARRFRVSRQLVEYRIKVTHLWQSYKGASASRAQHV